MPEMKMPSNSACFEYNGVQYCMTEEQIEAAYRYRQHQYRLEDAKRMIDTLVFGCDCATDLREEAFRDCVLVFEARYGVSYEKASSQEMLEEYLRRYDNRFDCDLDENSQWEAAIEAVLEDEKEGKLDEPRWKLGDDLREEDNLLDPVTFDDLILAVHCNCRHITRTAVHTELNQIIDSRKEDMVFLLERNMGAIIAAAKAGRETC